MPEPVKCWISPMGLVARLRQEEAGHNDTPGVWLPIDLLERLVEDRFYGAYLADFLGKPLPATTDTEGNTLRGLIRELREEA